MNQDVSSLVTKFIKTRLVNSAADKKVAMGTHFPATQLASCCPTLGLRMFNKSLEKRMSKAGSFVNFESFLVEILGQKVSTQLSLTEGLQSIANISASSFWLNIVTKGSTSVNGLGKLSSSLVIDYLATATGDSYPLLADSGEMSEMTLNTFYSWWSEIVSSYGAVDDAGDLSKVHQSNPLLRVGKILDHGSQKMIDYAEIIQVFLDFDYDGTADKYREDSYHMKLLSMMGMATLLSFNEVTIASDGGVSKYPEGLDFLEEYLKQVLNYVVKPKSKKVISKDSKFYVNIDDNNFQLFHGDVELVPGKVKFSKKQTSSLLLPTGRDDDDGDGPGDSSGFGGGSGKGKLSTSSPFSKSGSKASQSKGKPKGKVPQNVGGKGDGKVKGKVPGKGGGKDPQKTSTKGKGKINKPPVEAEENEEGDGGKDQEDQHGDHQELQNDVWWPEEMPRPDEENWHQEESTWGSAWEYYGDSKPRRCHGPTTSPLLSGRGILGLSRSVRS